jgi:hypothetical protein
MQLDAPIELAIQKQAGWSMCSFLAAKTLVSKSQIPCIYIASGKSGIDLVLKQHFATMKYSMIIDEQVTSL